MAQTIPLDFPSQDTFRCLNTPPPYLRLDVCTMFDIGITHFPPSGHGSITICLYPCINTYAPFTHFAGGAYCTPTLIMSWTCGAHCQGNPDFKPVASGGDGAATQYWYVGYSPSLKTVIVAHQGTDPTKFLADLTDLKFNPEPLDASLFPGIPTTVQAHSGFAKEHASTAPTILTNVQQTLSAQGATSVTVVGHSLGAAIALLDGVFLSLQLPKSVTVKVVGYGMPRVGNQDFANFVDDRLKGKVVHINNREDPIPVVPFISMGFHHPSGEIHIQDSGAWDDCPGQDNPSKTCSTGDVTNPLQVTVADHHGPYAGISMGC
ncbi:lipase [Lactifluus subvellereus]|nr:lipase [Lactifluus subvellereus]